MTSTPALEAMIDADHIVRGEGVAWMRRFLGDDPGRPLVHPVIPSSFGFRVMGLPSPRGGGSPAATIVPSVGRRSAATSARRRRSSAARGGS